jgi:hypothetical protein
MTEWFPVSYLSFKIGHWKFFSHSDFGISHFTAPPADAGNLVPPVTNCQSLPRA